MKLDNSTQHSYKRFNGNSSADKKYSLSFLRVDRHLPFSEELDDVINMPLKDEQAWTPRGNIYTAVSSVYIAKCIFADFEISLLKILKSIGPKMES